jgi:hypothetical protein
VFTGLVVDDGLDRPDDSWGSHLSHLVKEQVFFRLQVLLAHAAGPALFHIRDAERGRGLRTNACLGSSSERPTMGIEGLWPE